MYAESRNYRIGGIHMARSSRVLLFGIPSPNAFFVGLSHGSGSILTVIYIIINYIVNIVTTHCSYNIIIIFNSILSCTGGQRLAQNTFFYCVHHAI